MNLHERLRALAPAHVVASETRAIHLSAIREVVRAQPAPTSWVSRHRKAVAGWAAVFVTGLPSIAVASDTSNPGDTLYPVKRAVEWAWTWVDPDVSDRHRVEELEDLLAERADDDVLTAALDAARRAVDDRKLDDRLRVRVEVLAGSFAPDDDPGDGESLPIAPAVAEDPEDHPETTSTTMVDAHDDDDATSGDDYRDARRHHDDDDEIGGGFSDGDDDHEDSRDHDRDDESDDHHDGRSDDSHDDDDGSGEPDDD